jgi:hypothetical protein
MKRLYILGTIGAVILYGLAFWKNAKSYSWQPLQWRCIKSAADTTLVLLAAFYMPGLLIAWTVIWVVRGIKSPGMKTTFAVLIGVLLGSISGVALEILCILGICSVDLLTGQAGIYGWWTQPIPQDFMSSLNTPLENTSEI